VFGGRGDNARQYNIVQGRLTLNRNEVAQTFESVVDRIIESCLRLLRGRKIQASLIMEFQHTSDISKYLLLVGGFGDSPFLRKRLDEIFKTQGTEVVVIDEPS
jgi:molecular chaperone DnaK (HSP70)